MIWQSITIRSLDKLNLGDLFCTEISFSITIITYTFSSFQPIMINCGGWNINFMNKMLCFVLGIGKQMNIWQSILFTWQYTHICNFCWINIQEFLFIGGRGRGMVHSLNNSASPRQNKMLTDLRQWDRAWQCISTCTQIYSHSYSWSYTVNEFILASTMNYASPEQCKLYIMITRAATPQLTIKNAELNKSIDWFIISGWGARWWLRVESEARGN